VLVSLLAVLFSCTRILRISPALMARLSLTIEMGLVLLDHKESARAQVPARARTPAA
jgi:hypothetical protein